MHSRHQAEIVDLFCFREKQNIHLLRRAKQGQNGMMAVGRLVAPNSAVMPRLDRGIQYAAASRYPTAISGILDRPVKPDDDS
ncbi:hypothetical protein ACVWWG_000495 [Bradyrhizobium sp. LB7.2]